MRIHVCVWISGGGHWWRVVDIACMLSALRGNAQSDVIVSLYTNSSVSDVSEATAAAPVVRTSTVPNGDAIPSASASGDSSSSSDGDSASASSTSANIYASSTPAALMALKQAIAERDVRIDDLRAVIAAHEAKAADAAADAARAHTQVHRPHTSTNCFRCTHTPPVLDAHVQTLVFQMPMPTHLYFRCTHTPVFLCFS